MGAVTKIPKLDLYPEYLFRIDRSSGRAQKCRFGILGAQLGALVCVSVLGVLIPPAIGDSVSYYPIVLLFLLVALCATLIESRMRFEDKWFARRALAENLKQLVWEFAMGAPSGEGRSPARHLAESLQQLEGRLRGHVKSIGVARTKSVLVTEEMNRVRSLNWRDRFEYYKEHRLQDQIDWYSTKSSENATNSFRFEIAVVCIEVAALCIVGLEWWTKSSIHVWELIPAVGSMTIAWSLARRYEDLAITYEVAASDLGTLQSQAGSVETEAELLTWMKAVEEAVSREHQIWLAKSGRNWLRRRQP